MAATIYLQPGEYAAYGAPASTTVAQVTQASMLIDAYLRRPEGLVWTPDVNGNPIYMARKVPTVSFTVPAGLAPGLNVVATVAGPVATLKSGTVLVANKADVAKVESLSVISATGNSVTFAEVLRTQPVGCTLDDGLTIFETKQMPQNRPLMLLTRNPVMSILKAQGRYAYNRRGSSANYALNEFNLLAVMSQFGGPPIWQEIAVTQSDFNPQTGEVWIPAGIMLAYYTEVRMYYVAGFSIAALPDAVKFAVASLITTQVNTPLQGNLKSMRAGDTALERFINSIFDDETRIQLTPYKARLYA